MTDPSPYSSPVSSSGTSSRRSDSHKPGGRHQLREATRRERQREEILSAILQNRTSHALGLAFEHLDEFGIDQLLVQTLISAVAGRNDPALSIELDAFLRRLRDTTERRPMSEQRTGPQVPARE
jgi:hypothetical protein